jgi:hypothetical protein
VLGEKLGLCCTAQGELLKWTDGSLGIGGTSEVDILVNARIDTSCRWPERVSVGSA